MLKYLRIQNVILIEQVDILFSTGLNILTGETGSGKSAILHGFSLAIGERTDISLIRKGCDKAIVEAIFDIDQQPSLLTHLIEAGIDHELGQELIVRREISLSGKSRIFINHQVAQLSLLRQVGSYLVQVVGQHANQSLFSLDHHRKILDLYGDLEEEVQVYHTSFNRENRLKQELNTLIHQEAQRLREIAICQRELEELEEASLREGEDDELFAEYTTLTHANELSEKVKEVQQALSGERQAVLTILNRQKAILDSIVSFDRALLETAQAFQNALLELQEIAHTLRQYHNRIQNNPERLLFINDRLSLINRLKRQYGATITDIQDYQSQTKTRLVHLENADIQIEELRLQLKNAEETTQRLASELTAHRQRVAIQLEQALTQQIQSLNMSKAEFIIIITPQKRTTSGDDKVEFFLKPNKGEHQIALKEGVSGGEISRILLALQTLLAGREKTSTLLFDEVDANIGGETATIIGDKLREIGQQHQVICITHFPQVAAQAHHHLQVLKEEKEERTFTSVRNLDQISRQQELQRMAGGNTVLNTTLKVM